MTANLNPSTAKAQNITALVPSKPILTKPPITQPPCLEPVPYEDAFDWRKTESLKFMVQILLTLLVIMFCFGKLTFSNGDANDKALYWSGITSILAWWMPSPGASKSSNSMKEEKR
jgi:hypothetical protein